MFFICRKKTSIERNGRVMLIYFKLTQFQRTKFNNPAITNKSFITQPNYWCKRVNKFHHRLEVMTDPQAVLGILKFSWL